MSATPKLHSQRAHAKRRLAERFGVTVNRQEYREIVEQIREGRSTQIDRQSLRVTRHRVNVGGVEMIAVWDSARKAIVTFMPIEWLRPRDGRGT